jgi:predicted dehydrogenase
LRVGIIGTGAISHKHVQAYRNIGYQLVACSALDPGHGKKFAHQYGCELRTIAGGKKTVEAFRQEITREVEQFLRVVFQGRRKAGRLDLEAIETAVRSAMHRAGASALSELLQFPAPDVGQRSIHGCGHQTHYRELRTKSSPRWAR